MRTSFLFLFLLAVGSVCLAQQSPAAAPAANAAPAAADAVNTANLGPANQNFIQLMDSLNEIGKKLQGMQKEFAKATPERQKEIQTEGRAIIEKLQSQQKAIVAAAKAAYQEAPNANKKVSDLLLQNLYMKIEYDDFESALLEADSLIKAGMKTPAVFELAGYAAFNANSFDYAEKALTFAKSKGELSAPSQQVFDDLPYYKAAWLKERAAREANAQKKDCPIVQMTTSVGEMEIELFVNEAPNTVANFVDLVNKGFYNGLTFHRVLSGFMAQGGDPTGTGAGGPGYCIPCEVDNIAARKHFRGTLSMAHAGKDTGGSQFFLTFVPTKHLDGKHTVFGRVSKGMDVLAKIQKINPSQPVPGLEPTKIISAKVIYMPNKPLPELKKLPERK